MKGLIHLYYGEGKGKTTAAAGLALRAAGSGKKVVFVQFLKGSISGEVEAFGQLEQIEVFRNEKDMGFLNSMSREQVEQVVAIHNRNLQKSWEMVGKKQCDLLVLDEICAAYEYKVIDRKLVDKLLTEKPKELEIVLTGRNPAEIFIKSADYITEMRKVRHPYDKGIAARKGIEY